MDVLHVILKADFRQMIAHPPKDGHPGGHWQECPYIRAGVVRQGAVVRQGDAFLLPLFIQRAAAPLPQDALLKKPNQE